MSRCKLCGSEAVSRVGYAPSPYFKGLSYSLYSCDGCECNFFDPKEHPVDLQDMFDKLDSDNQSFDVKFSKSLYWEFHKNLIVKQFGRNPKSVLDVGCRTGAFLMHFDAEVVKEGVELSTVAANIASKRGIIAHNNYIENIKFNSKFDVVTSFAVLEHLPEPMKFLDSVQSWVNDKGLLVLMAPTHQCLKEKLAALFNKTWRMYTPPSHLNFYSRKWLDDTLKKEGFILEKRYYTSGGAFNPFSKIPLLGRAFQGFMYLIDKTPLNRWPIFDHQYSYYRKGEHKKH